MKWSIRNILPGGSNDASASKDINPVCSSMRAIIPTESARTEAINTGAPSSNILSVGEQQFSRRRIAQIAKSVVHSSPSVQHERLLDVDEDDLQFEKTNSSLSLQNRENSTSQFPSGAFIQPLMSVSHTRLMESWLNEKLAASENNALLIAIDEFSDAPEKIQGEAIPYAIDYQTLDKVGLSRQALQSKGLPQQSIERLYRGLYVYSTGVHELFRDIVAHCFESEPIQHCLWNAFISLIDSSRDFNSNSLSDMIRRKQNQKLQGMLKCLQTMKRKAEQEQHEFGIKQTQLQQQLDSEKKQRNDAEILIKEQARTIMIINEQLIELCRKNDATTKRMLESHLRLNQAKHDICHLSDENQRVKMNLSTEVLERQHAVESLEACQSKIEALKLAENKWRSEAFVCISKFEEARVLLKDNQALLLSRERQLKSCCSIQETLESRTHNLQAENRVLQEAVARSKLNHEKSSQQTKSMLHIITGQMAALNRADTSLKSAQILQKSLISEVEKSKHLLFLTVNELEQTKYQHNLSFCNQFKQLSSELEETKDISAQYQNDKAVLQKIRESLEAERSVAQNDLRTLKEKLVKLEKSAALDSLSLETKDLNISSLRKEIETVKEQNAFIQATFQEERTKMTGLIRKQRLNFEKVDKERVSLKQDLMELRLKHEKLKIKTRDDSELAATASTTLREKAKHIDRITVELETSQQDLHLLRDERQVITKQIEDLRESLQNKDIMMRDLKEDASNFKVLRFKHEVLHSKCQTAERNLIKMQSSAKSTIEALNEKLKSTKSKMKANLEYETKRLQSAELVCADRAVRINTLEELLDTSTYANEELKFDLTRITKESKRINLQLVNVLEINRSLSTHAGWVEAVSDSGASDADLALQNSKLSKLLHEQQAVTSNLELQLKTLKDFPKESVDVGVQCVVHCVNTASQTSPELRNENLKLPVSPRASPMPSTRARHSIALQMDPSEAALLNSYRMQTMAQASNSITSTETINTQDFKPKLEDSDMHAEARTIETTEVTEAAAAIPITEAATPAATLAAVATALTNERMVKQKRRERKQSISHSNNILSHTLASVVVRSRLREVNRVSVFNEPDDENETIPDINFTPLCRRRMSLSGPLANARQDTLPDIELDAAIVGTSRLTHHPSALVNTNNALNYASTIPTTTTTTSTSPTRRRTSRVERKTSAVFMPLVNPAELMVRSAHSPTSTNRSDTFESILHSTDQYNTFIPKYNK